MSQLHRLAAPSLIDPKAMHAVVQVITGRDGRKHPLHAPAFVRNGVRILQEAIIPGRGIGSRRRTNGGVGVSGTHLQAMIIRMEGKNSGFNKSEKSIWRARELLKFSGRGRWPGFL